MSYLKVILFSLVIFAGGVILYFLVRDNFPSKQNDLANSNVSPTSLGTLLPQINSEGPVTVKVTPKDLSQSATSWDFEILLDTHSQNLGNSDLINNSVLLDDKGNQFNPIYWEDLPSDEVEPPQEHHRTGILKFRPISPKPESIELKIHQIGNINERIFKWDLE